MKIGALTADSRYNERSRSSAINTAPAPDIRPAYTGANAMAKYRPIPTFSDAQIEYFWSRIDRSDGPNACWPWLGITDRDGYGLVKISQTQYRVHRIAYALAFGEMPVDLTIDHVRERGCSNRACANPSHLEPVPAGINTLRGNSLPSINHRKTHCVHGHEFSPENTYVWHGAEGQVRGCVICRKERSRRDALRKLHPPLPSCCSICGTEFQPRTRLNFCCSDACRVTWARRRDGLRKRNRRVALEQAA